MADGTRKPSTTKFDLFCQQLYTYIEAPSNTYIEAPSNAIKYKFPMNV